MGFRTHSCLPLYTCLVISDSLVFSPACSVVVFSSTCNITITVHCFMQAMMFCTLQKCIQLAVYAFLYKVMLHVGYLAFKQYYMQGMQQCALLHVSYITVSSAQSDTCRTFSSKTMLLMQACRMLTYLALYQPAGNVALLAVFSSTVQC